MKGKEEEEQKEATTYSWISSGEDVAEGRAAATLEPSAVAGRCGPFVPASCSGVCGLLRAQRRAKAAYYGAVAATAQRLFCCLMLFSAGAATPLSPLWRYLLPAATGARKMKALGVYCYTLCIFRGRPRLSSACCCGDSVVACLGAEQTLKRTRFGRCAGRKEERSAGMHFARAVLYSIATGRHFARACALALCCWQQQWRRLTAYRAGLSRTAA